VHKDQKNYDNTKLKVGRAYRIDCDMATNPFQELDFIVDSERRRINFNVIILEEHDNFFLAKALEDEDIINSINVTISKSHLITSTINLKLLN
jgi:hypothetical protein